MVILAIFFEHRWLNLHSFSSVILFLSFIISLLSLLEDIREWWKKGWLLGRKDSSSCRNFNSLRIS